MTLHVKFPLRCAFSLSAMLAMSPTWAMDQNVDYRQPITETVTARCAQGRVEKAHWFALLTTLGMTPRAAIAVAVDGDGRLQSLAVSYTGSRSGIMTATAVAADARQVAALAATTHCPAQVLIGQTKQD